MASPALVMNLREKKRNWLLERNCVLQSIREKKAAVQEFSGNLENLDVDKDSTSKLHVLGKLVASVKQRPASDTLSIRMHASFMQITLRSIEARRDRMLKYKASLDDLGKNYRDASDRLMEEYHIPVPELGISSPSPPEVTGCFTEGVTICTESYMIDGPESSLRNVLITEDSGDEPVTYRRMGNVIIEKTAEVPVG